MSGQCYFKIYVFNFTELLFRAITHNPDVYPEPEKFIPERHLRENGEVDDSTVYSIVAYGFGRRCVFSCTSLDTCSKSFTFLKSMCWQTFCWYYSLAHYGLFIGNYEYLYGERCWRLGYWRTLLGFGLMVSTWHPHCLQIGHLLIMISLSAISQKYQGVRLVQGSLMMNLRQC